VSPSAGFDSEFSYELCVCRWAELAWPPGESVGDADSTALTTHIVARQLGTQKRRWDTVIVEVDPAALRNRAAFGDAELDSDLLHILRNAPAEWAWYREALPEPDYPWRYVREAIHRAADRDILHTRRAGNRIEIRRIAPYPDWLVRLIAIENHREQTRSRRECRPATGRPTHPRRGRRTRRRGLGCDEPNRRVGRTGVARSAPR